MSISQKISIVVPTLNSADSLERCLKSVCWANEIIIVDMGSTDATKEIARKFGAKVYTRMPDDGNFDTNRKYGMVKATKDWILKLDSDEMLLPDLQKEIQHVLKNNDKLVNGYNLYNHIFMFGYQIKHGFVKAHSHELRLVRNGKWHYNPYRFHQQITVEGGIGYLKNAYEHYNVGSVTDFIQKMNKYTEVDARHYVRKISVATTVLAPFKTFLKLFFWQVGFLDGCVGFIVCTLFAIYNLVEKVKAWEFQNI